MIEPFPNWIDTTYSALRVASAAGATSLIHRFQHVDQSTVSLHDFAGQRVLALLPYSIFQITCFEDTCHVYGRSATWLPKHLATYNLHSLRDFCQNFYLDPEIMKPLLTTGFLTLLVLITGCIFYQLLVLLIHASLACA
jgi:hypothetical protein